MKKLIFILTITLSTNMALAHAALSDVTHQTMLEVLKIAKAISAVQPFIDDTKLMEYGLGIYRASKKYDIDPKVLIAITQQETNFRENLPEGAAGEIGICQIRKAWLKHPGFRKEFRHAKIKDLHRPSKSFLFAAWILRDLKHRSHGSRTLPYWSYYNSVKFENRFKYFVAVNKYYSALRKFEARETRLMEAANAPAQPASQTLSPSEIAPREVASPAQGRVPTAAPAPVGKREASRLQPQPELEGRWISDALQKLQERDSQIPQYHLPQPRQAQPAPQADASDTYRAPANATALGVSAELPN